MERFLKILNCRMMSFPFTYLDVPIEVNPRCERTWVLILEKISKKLVSWKHKHFSLVGEFVFLNSVISFFALSFLSIFVQNSYKGG